MPQENDVPNNETAQQLFDHALSAQRQKNGEEALKLYQDALFKGPGILSPPQISVIYHNMSTIAYEKADFLRAYVWSKKATLMDPGNRMAQQAREQYAKKFEIPTVAHQISASQNLQKVLTQVPLDFLFVLCLLFLFFTLRLFFKNLLTRRQNQIASVVTTSFAWKPLVISILFLLTLTFAGMRWNIDQRTLAIIVAEKTGIQTASGENKPVIFEAPLGLEVEVLSFSEGWAQIRYPGAFSGWVPIQNLEILTDIFVRK